MLTRQRLLTLLLMLLGLLQTAGWITQSRLLTVGFASAASPFADVFGVVDEFEPMSHLYTAEIFTADGKAHTAEISRKISHRLAREPGFMLRFSPYLYAIGWFPLVQPELRTQLLRHAFCETAPFAEALGIEGRVERIELTVESKTPRKTRYEIEGRNVLELSCPQ